MPWKGKKPVARKSTKGKKSDAHIVKVAKEVFKRQVETKFFDVRQASALPCDNSGLIFGLSAITQGTSASSRIGTEIELQKLIFKSVIYGGAPGGVFQRFSFRMVLFKLKPDDIVAPTVGTIFNNIDIASANAPMGMYNVDSQPDVTIIWDSGAITPPSYTVPIVINKAITLRGKSMYNTGPAAPGNNKVYLVVISDSVLLTAPYFGFNSRLLYKDA